MRAMINAYLGFVIRWPRCFLLLLLVITIGLGAGVLRIEFDNSIEAFMPEGDPEYIKYQQAKEIYGDNDRFLIMAVSGNPLWAPRTLERIDHFITDIEAFEECEPETENQRMQRLMRVAANPPVSYEALLAAFADDPAYQRFIDRKLSPGKGHTDRISGKSLARLKKEAERFAVLRQSECIDAILSPFTIEDISGTFDTLKTVSLMPEDDDGNRIIPDNPSEIKDFQERLTRNPDFQKGIYAVDDETGEITDFACIVKFKTDSNRIAIVAEIVDIIQHYEDLDIIVSGVPYVNHKFNQYMQNDLLRNIPLVLLVVIIVFYFNFRSIRGIILPLFTLGMAEIWTVGLMGHLGVPITTVGITLPPLLIAVGSSYAIHVLNQYYADFDIVTRKGRSAGLLEAMSHISFTVYLAGLTTFAAFLTLLSSRVSGIEEWGVFSAIGVMFTVFISITVIPAMLRLLPHRFPKALVRRNNEIKTTLVDRTLQLCAAGAVRHHRKVFAITGLVILISVAGMLQLEVDTEFLHYFKPDDPTRKNTVIIGDKFGGGWGFDIIFDSGEADGIKSPAFLQAVEEVRRWLVAENNDHLNIGRTDGFSDFIKRMHMAMYNDDPDHYQIPENRLTILDYLEIFTGEDSDSDGRPDAFEPFVDRDYQRTNVLARLNRESTDRIGTAEISRIIENIRGHLDEHLPAQYSYTITGYPVINVKLAYYVITGQLMGLLLSLGFVFIVIVALYRRLMAGPLALIDMGVTIIINFGIMGWFGIYLDMVTSVIATITIGIGVDDTIHFLNTYRAHKDKSTTVPDAIRKTMFVSGKAILFTSIALTCGFLVQMTSNFLPVVLFALLISLTMVNTTIGSILLVPAAIRGTGINLDKDAEGRESYPVAETAEIG